MTYKSLYSFFFPSFLLSISTIILLISSSLQADDSLLLTSNQRATTIINVNGVPQLIEYDIVDGRAIYQGDIELGEVNLLGDLKIAVRGTLKWPNGIVFYDFHRNFDEQRQLDALWAMEHIQENTGIIFIPRTYQRARIVFKEVNDRCSSFIGRTGVSQAIRLAPRCSRGTIVHEILHALGLWHTHSRSDRDEHVIIHWENIRLLSRHNFQKHTDGIFMGQRGYDIGPYDIDSIMHYGSYAFCRRDSNGGCRRDENGSRLPTITRLDGTTFGAQRDRMSPHDIAAVKQYYHEEITPQCQRIDHGTLEVESYKRRRFLLADRHRTYGLFEDRDQANRKLYWLRSERITTICHLRVNYSPREFHYFLTNSGELPQNGISRENCRNITRNFDIKRRRKGHYDLVSGAPIRRRFMRIQNSELAYGTYAAIKRNDFTRFCRGYSSLQGQGYFR